ncbi:MAG: DNA polymerase III subunit delta', partial [Ignavibacteriae bacterium]|nr:DNA polymerase III subunit delta' [Ignavibacteriota bacterium]
MSWDSIVNQARIKELFRSILTRKRLAHAYIFSGSEGVGKDAVAIELAKVVN